ncbi:hypothetical protein Sjap_000037 [Stephania japonica]|uniref:Fe2OG dioxygenase domain-containing protein n=1 Tax=Stephania japonica TaxID=461633 RepID=A0AAP0PQC7_9MAGN
MVGGGGEVVRVQALAESGSGSGVPNIINVPSQFIQPPEKRPVLGPGPGPGGESGVPVVDLSDWEGAREEVGRACRDWGGFQVRNHGVGIGLLNQMRSAGLHLFRECSMEEKLRYSCDPHTPASEGYGSRMLQVVDNIESVVLDWRDYFDHHTFPLSRRDPTRWPQFLPNYRELVAAYSDEMKKLALKLLSLISQSLGLPSSCIQDKIWGEEEEEEEEVYQNVTVSYYPPCPRPDLTLGLQPHSDMGALTLLVQDDVGGLQLLKDDHNWVTVPPISDAILVLLADQTEIISNGKYRSAPHRALTNPHYPRLSVATFHDPSKTLGGLLRDQRGDVYGVFARRVATRFSPEAAEAVAVREGLQFSIQSGFVVHVIETNAATVLQAIQRRIFGSQIAPLI